MTRCDHRVWERIEPRPCVMHLGEICPIHCTYERCLDCRTRRLHAEGQPTYLITDESIEVAA